MLDLVRLQLRLLPIAKTLNSSLPTGSVGSGIEPFEAELDVVLGQLIENVPCVVTPRRSGTSVSDRPTRSHLDAANGSARSHISTSSPPPHSCYARVGPPANQPPRHTRWIAVAGTHGHAEARHENLPRQLLSPVSSLATLFWVVVLIVSLVRPLPQELPSAVDDGLRILHVVQLVRRLVQCPLGWTLSMRRFIRHGVHHSPSGEDRRAWWHLTLHLEHRIHLPPCAWKRGHPALQVAPDGTLLNLAAVAPRL